MAIRFALRRRNPVGLKLYVHGGNPAAGRSLGHGSIPLAIILGMVVFIEFPDGLSYARMGLNIAAGIYAAHREAILSRKVNKPP